MKRKILIVFVAIFTAMLTSCDWYADPQIVGLSKIELNNEGTFVCCVNNQSSYKVDSVLTIKKGLKTYEKPTVGSEITIFTFTGKNDNTYFYKGHASPKEIKKTYFQGHTGSSSIKFSIFFIGVMSFYGWANYSYGKEKQNKKNQNDV